jgi:hypothetical protein
MHPSPSIAAFAALSALHGDAVPDFSTVATAPAMLTLMLASLFLFSFAVRARDKRK